MRKQYFSPETEAQSIDSPQVPADSVNIATYQKMNILPPRNTKRWVSSRKAQIVQAVNQGILTYEQACQIYNLSKEELLSWQNLAAYHGSDGLRVTKLQKYRRKKRN